MWVRGEGVVELNNKFEKKTKGVWLPNLNFQMGLKRVQMEYDSSTILFMMGYIIGVCILPSKIERFVGKLIK